MKPDSSRWLRSRLAQATLALGLAVTVLPSRMVAQDTSDSVVVMPAGKYVLEARDSTKPVGIAGFEFELKAGGDFKISSPDGSFSGKMIQKDGILTYTDQGCADAGTYVVKMERGGYVIVPKSDPCEGRGDGMAMLLFRPVGS
jgi:hypothetical protein